MKHVEIEPINGKRRCACGWIEETQSQPDPKLAELIAAAEAIVNNTAWSQPIMRLRAAIAAYLILPRS